jgi:hypothetical protein
MREDGHAEALFTTMVDLYALPTEFPGWDEARKKARPRDRVSNLEAAFQAEMSDRRFHPHIQLHEFEALLYCDLSQLQRRISNSEAAITALLRDVVGLAPEDINEGATTAPSKRIIRHLRKRKYASAHRPRRQLGYRYCGQSVLISMGGCASLRAWGRRYESAMRVI